MCVPDLCNENFKILLQPEVQNLLCKSKSLFDMKCTFCIFALDLTPIYNLFIYMYIYYFVYRYLYEYNLLNQSNNRIVFLFYSFFILNLFGILFLFTLFSFREPNAMLTQLALFPQFHLPFNR